MFKFIVVVVGLIGCEASPAYDYSAPAVNADYGGSHAPVLTGGLSSVINSPIGAGYSLPYGFASKGGPIGFSAPFSFGGQLPVHAHRSVEVAPAHVQHESIGPQIIEVAGDDQPVQVLFRSHGSRVHVQQIHTPTPGGHVESTRTEEEPHRVIHEVIRPVIQEVREVIQPYRRLTQEIRPVLEEVHTVVAKGEKRHSYGAQPALVATGGIETTHGLAGSGYKAKKAA